MNVLPGSKVQFNMLVSGTPPLNIKWFKDKKEIVSSNDCSVTKDNTSSSLELFFAKTSDSGEYVCEVQNDVGSTSCQATLFVKGLFSLSHIPKCKEFEKKMLQGRNAAILNCNSFMIE